MRGPRATWLAPGVAWLLVGLAVLGPILWVGWLPMDHPEQWPSTAAALVLRPPQGWQQLPWVWWSAAWVHGSAQHWLFNALGVLLISGGGAWLRMPTSLAVAWALSWPLGHACLMLDPRLTFYMGASGVLHAGVAVLGVGIWQTGQRRLAGALLLALALKVGHEAWLGWPGGATLVRGGVDVPVAWLAHVSGALSGLFIAGIHGASRRHTP